MGIPALDQAVKDIAELKKQVEELISATEFLKQIKFEGRGKIIVSGVEFKINSSTNVAEIITDISSLQTRISVLEARP
jgi:predicted nucleotide-binding protein (sugar kinase/HSP70/actin superfamily)